jgi:hypothetical protein
LEEHEPDIVTPAEQECLEDKNTLAFLCGVAFMHFGLVLFMLIKTDKVKVIN